MWTVTLFQELFRYYETTGLVPKGPCNTFPNSNKNVSLLAHDASRITCRKIFRMGHVQAELHVFSTNFPESYAGTTRGQEVPLHQRVSWTSELSFVVFLWTCSLRSLYQERTATKQLTMLKSATAADVSSIWHRTISHNLYREEGAISSWLWKLILNSRPHAAPQFLARVFSGPLTAHWQPFPTMLKKCSRVFLRASQVLMCRWLLYQA